MVGFPSMTSPVSYLALLLSLCSLVLSKHSDASATVTAAPVYLPYYNDNDWWALVRGSIIAQNTTASETTYTIFCPAQTTPTCNLALQFPFIIVEGPKTLQFHGTYTSTYIANLECDLAGTTAATCSGYSSFAPGYTVGSFSGPTEVSWTSTFTGSEVEWGTLTMATVPTATDDSVIAQTGFTMPGTAATDYMVLPTETDDAESGAAGLISSSRGPCVAAAAAAAFLLGMVMA